MNKLLSHSIVQDTSLFIPLIGILLKRIAFEDTSVVIALFLFLVVLLVLLS